MEEPLKQKLLLPILAKWQYDILIFSKFLITRFASWFVHEVSRSVDVYIVYVIVMLRRCWCVRGGGRFIVGDSMSSVVARIKFTSFTTHPVLSMPVAGFVQIFLKKKKRFLLPCHTYFVVSKLVINMV